MNIKEFVDYLKKEYSPALVHVEHLPGKPGSYMDYKFSSPRIQEWVERSGIRFYSHQALAWKEFFDRSHDLVVTTPTASGKSLIYALAAFELYEQDKSSTFLLIYPTRALLSDQYFKLKRLARDLRIDLAIGRFYGDYKSRGQMLLTTPDSLHANILRRHDYWAKFFRNLRLVVVDELHSYYGLLGSNLALVFRRLGYLLREIYKNSSYRIIATSATIKDPIAHAKALFGEERDFSLISESGAPEPERYWVFLNPAAYESLPGSKNRENIRKFLLDLIADELRLIEGAKILTFLDSRKFVERLYFSLTQYYPELSKLVYVYKGTFTRDVRREIERRFKLGELRCLIATNALELGIDIGDLNVVNNLGIPGDGISSILQRFGRAGRDPGQLALNVLIFKKNALDQYYATNIDELIRKLKLKDVEQPVITLSNPRLLKEHVLYLIYEVSRVRNGLEASKLPESWRAAAEQLASEGKVTRLETIFGERVYSVPSTAEPRYMKLRSIDEEYSLVDVDIGKVIETLDKRSVYSDALPGFSYISHGKLYRVLEIDEEKKLVKLQRSEEFSITEPITEEEVEILEVWKSKQFRDASIFLGKIKLRKYIHGYIEKYYSSEEETWKYLGSPKLYEKPFVYELETSAIWLTLPSEYEDVENLYYKHFWEQLERLINELSLDRDRLYELVDELYDELDYYELYRYKLGKVREYVESIISEKLYASRVQVPGYYFNETVKLIRKLIESKYALESGIHGIEHAMILLAPTVSMIDSRELGGRSFKEHPQTGRPTIFVYEAIPGGIGYSQILYSQIENLLQKVHSRLKSCNCLDGCPKCIYSPRCGNANEFLDRIAGLFILQKLLFGRT